MLADRRSRKWTFLLTMKENKDPYEGYPKHFLAETPGEAEQIFTRYSTLLNGISYTYSISTGIEKGELFGEAIMGLAKALKNFDETLGYSFKTFAVKVIRNVLNEFSRKNVYTIYPPAYIKRSNLLIQKLKHVLEQGKMDEQQVDYVLREGNLKPLNLSTDIGDRAEKFIVLLKREAKRSSTSYEALTSRAEYIPEEVDLTDETIEKKHVSDTDEKHLEVALFVEKLKEYMTAIELSICEGIMNDKTYDQIAQEHGRTRPWVHQRLDKLKQKLIHRLKDGTITL